MIAVYVQIGDAAVQWTTFGRFGNRERLICQRLSNRMKSEVRALRENSLLARFVPHRVECSEGC